MELILAHGMAHLWWSFRFVDDMAEPFVSSLHKVRPEIFIDALLQLLLLFVLSKLNGRLELSTSQWLWCPVQQGWHCHWMAQWVALEGWLLWWLLQNIRFICWSLNVYWRIQITVTQWANWVGLLADKCLDGWLQWSRGATVWCNFLNALRNGQLRWAWFQWLDDAQWSGSSQTERAGLKWMDYGRSLSMMICLWANGCRRAFEKAAWEETEFSDQIANCLLNTPANNNHIIFWG